ncbi:hypothetical protein GPECTOR_1g517 [Gonium pectorale]|uniref:FIST domain-containing protein n=1 Tax=Gonium pectorale TaxID=33097 RepID=A0A150H3H1_GONPE|nr:hypothetical protein GPECTOR_1g517 [Gonium pectorale]|eukprot:KXZ56575.1 hypothetical protein GPECTOR_1g517 [Gonium pectorale]
MRRHRDALVRHARAAAHRLADTRGMFFVSASYQGRSLLSAATELADTVREAMGPSRPAHLVALFATPWAEWGSGLAETPNVHRRTSPARPPVALAVPGGCPQRVAGGSHYPREGEPCVSLLAAHLPGVRLLPFHAATGSLPSLGPSGAWTELVRAARASAGAGANAAGARAAAAPGGGGPGGGGAELAAGAGGGVPAGSGSHPAAGAAEEGDRRAAGSSTAAEGPPPPAASAAPRPAESVAALLLSTPHFLEVEELLGRFGLVAPGMQVVGGVTAPGAWGESESNWGAVWLNDQVYAKGAVGCILRGPFKLDTIASPGFRGAGPVMRVTQAQGQSVLEVDGEPVQKPLQRAISEALNSGELATALKIGHHHDHQQPQQPQQLVTRNWFFRQAPPRPAMTVATSEPITRGTAIQVHLQNYPAAHRDMRDRLRDYAQRLPPGAAAAAGGVGVLALSCSSLPFLEDTDVARCLPGAAFAGGKVEGEVCSTLEGQPSRLHSFTSCMALLRAADGPGDASA